MRLIDADKIIVNTFRQNLVDGYKLWRTDFDGLLNIIDEQPTVDVFEQIRSEIEGELEQDNHSFYRAALGDVLKIIDKYREGEKE